MSLIYIALGGGLGAVALAFGLPAFIDANRALRFGGLVLAAATSRRLERPRAPPEAIGNASLPYLPGLPRWVAGEA